MRFGEPHAEAHAGFRWRDLFDFGPVMEGIRYIASERHRRVLIFAKAGVGLLGSNYVILTLMGSREFPLTWSGRSAAEAGMLGISALMSARGLGAILGPMSAAQFCGPRKSRMKWVIALGFFCVFAGYMALSRAGGYWQAFAAVTIAHAGASAVWVLTANLQQEFSEDAYRGRVMAADFAALTTAISLSSYVAGISVDAGVTVRLVALLTGAVMLVPLAAWLVATRGWFEHGQSPPPGSDART
jgi:hypothetical protein